MSAGAAGAVERPTSTAGGSAVALADVTIAFRLADGGSYEAVQGASLDVADGEFVAIVGPTGCGKSTLLNVTAGLFPPSVRPRRHFRRAVSPASTGSPATCSSPRRCFPGRPRSRTSRSGSRPRARRAIGGARARAGLAHARGTWQLRPALSAHALRRAEKARRPRAGADPRPEDPADGRAVRPARRADPADHGQPAARSVERRPQGGDVRHPRPRGGDRAVRPRGDHVGGAGRAHHRRLAGAACRARATSPRSSSSRRSTSCTAKSGRC